MTTWPLTPAADAVRRLKDGARAVDVRSPGEFAQGSLPRTINRPVLDDEVRHRVGWTYKHEGPEAAVRLGAELVEPRRDELVAGWRDALADASADDDRLLFCWRGGLRSKRSADALAEAGVGGRRVEGGYKAMRAVLLERMQRAPEMLVLSGLTGGGKTELLREYASALDLEDLARHRGSAFGLRPADHQPAQSTFENAVAFAIDDDRREMLVEDEGPMVGRNVVPAEVRARIVRGPVVWLEVSESERVRRSFEEYVLGPVATFGRATTLTHLRSAFQAVSRRLGGLRTREMTEALELGFAAPELRLEDFADLIRRLLLEYYDPMYRYGFEKHARSILFKGDRAAVREFLRERL